MSDDTDPGSKRAEKEQNQEEREHEHEQHNIEEAEAAHRPDEDPLDEKPSAKEQDER